MANIKGWLPRSLSRRLVVVRSIPRIKRLHFLTSDGASVNCPGDGCVFCGVYPLKQHAVVAVNLINQTDLYVLELTQAHLDLRLMLAAEGPACVGAVLQVTSVKGLRNEPLDIKQVDFEPARAVCVDRYIDAIGRKAYAKACISMKLSL